MKKTLNNLEEWSVIFHIDIDFSCRPEEIVDKIQRKHSEIYSGLGILIEGLEEANE